MSNFHVFRQKLDHQICTNECKRKVYWEWEYSVPPTWLTNKISNEILRNEINTINNVSIDETPKLCCSQITVFIVSIIISGLIIGLPQAIWWKPDSEYPISVVIFKYICLGIGGIIFVGEIIVWLYLGFKQIKNAEIGREKAIEYISTLNDKYKHKGVSFSTHKREFNQCIDIIVSLGSNNIMGAIIVPVGGSVDTPLLNNNYEGNSYKTTQLGTINFCSKCGNNVKDMTFCSKCGKKI